MKFSKLSNWYRELLFPAGLMAALIMGAGIFSLPYLFSVAGVAAGFLYLLIFAGVFSIIHLMYSDIIKTTPGDHRFVGYSKMYLGNGGFYLSFLTTLIGIILVLLIYLVLAVNFAKAVFPGIPEYIIFLSAWIVFSLSVASGIERLARLDIFITALKFLIIGGVFVLGVSRFDVGTFPINPLYLFLPYSAVLFSLSGRSAISSIHQYLTENNISEKHLKPALIVGTFAPAIFYALFVIGVLGISSGVAVTPDAVSGITEAAPWIGVVVATLGLLSLWTAYTFLGFEAQSILSKDFNLTNVISASIVAFVPLVLYFLGFNNFLELIGVSGGVLLSLESVLVILMWQKVSKAKIVFKVASSGLMMVFVVAGLVELISFFR